MKKPLEEHAARFDELAAEYDENQSEEYRACASLVVEYAAPSPDDVVLDLGCGTGAIALALAGGTGSVSASASEERSDLRAGRPTDGRPAAERAARDHRSLGPCERAQSAREQTGRNDPRAPGAGRVVGRDISEGMLERAREKATAQGLENVEFGRGSFREPNAPERPVDVVTSNFAMHHLSDEEKREAIQVVADLGARRFVLGDVMFFGDPDPEEPFYSPEVDDPATVGMLADALTDAGFVLTAVEMVHDQVGVLVAERAGYSSD